MVLVSCGLVVVVVVVLWLWLWWERISTFSWGKIMLRIYAKKGVGSDPLGWVKSATGFRFLDNPVPVFGQPG